MKKIITTLAAALILSFAHAQADAHEYMNVEFLAGWGRMTLVATNGETEKLDFTTIDKKDANVWMKTALTKIQELEAKGWTVVEFGLTYPTYVWMLRKPKQ